MTWFHHKLLRGVEEARLRAMTFTSARRRASLTIRRVLNVLSISSNEQDYKRVTKTLSTR